LRVAIAIGATEFVAIGQETKNQKDIVAVPVAPKDTFDKLKLDDVGVLQSALF
jgi:predicted phosphoribosyltransferase